MQFRGLSFRTFSIRKLLIAVGLVTVCIGSAANVMRHSERVRQLNAVALHAHPSTELDYKEFRLVWGARWHRLFGVRPIVGAIVEVEQLSKFVDLSSEYDYLAFVVVSGVGQNIDDSLPLLANLPSGVTHITLASCTVTDFSELEHMKGLLGLDLWSCKSGNWQSLARVKGLRWVRLRDYNPAINLPAGDVRDRSVLVRQLQAQMPDCRFLIRRNPSSPCLWSPFHGS